MKRLIVLNRYFFPDHSATSQLLSDLMFYFASARVDVHVITSRQLYDDPQRELPASAIERGVFIHRVSTTRFGRSGLPGRALDYLSFYYSAYNFMRNLIEPGGTVVAMTDPPLCSILAMWAARKKGARLVNWLQDIYPEIAIELGVPLFKGPIAFGVCYWRDRSLKSAAVNVVVGEGMAERLVKRGLTSAHLKVIHNWTDDTEIVPIPHKQNQLRRLWGLEDKFVVGYSGNLGRAHEFDTVLAASERLRHDPRIIFLFIGSGHNLDKLANLANSRGLAANFRFMPYQERPLLKYSLGVPDLHWLSLKPELEGLIVPSKFYGIAAAGRPIIAITAADGEIANLVRDNHCGRVIEPGENEKLAATILELSKDPDQLATMGRNARAMLDSRFTRRAALRRWHDVLDEVGMTLDTSSLDHVAKFQVITPSANPSLIEEDQSGTSLQ
jgi:glycosyltransferase involved in cell wall biosynthesis